VKNIVVRPLIFTGSLLCAAGFADVARAEIPGTDAAPATATATQSAVAAATPAAPPVVPEMTAIAPSRPTTTVAPVVTTRVTNVVKAPVAAATNVTTAVRAPTEVQAGAAKLTQTAVHLISTTAAQTQAPIAPRPSRDSDSTAVRPHQHASSQPELPAATAANARPTTDAKHTVAAPVPSHGARRSATPSATVARPSTFAHEPQATRPAADNAGGVTPPRLPPRLPQQFPGAALLAAFGQAGGGGILLFGLLGFLFLLAIPTAVRWLRPALALGLSPAYVALRDHPG
jgi:hypothetical protein